MTLFNIHFMRPLWLLSLLPFFLCLLLLYFRRHRSSSWQSICDPHLLPSVMANKSHHQILWPLYLLALCWLLIAVALAGPGITKRKMPLFRHQGADVIVLDMSPLMNAGDIKPSRLTRAKFKLRDLLRRHREGQVGLVVFSGQPFVVSPLTDDSHTIAAMIPQLRTAIMPIAGADIAWSLKMAAKLLHQAGASHGRIFLLTANAATAAAINTAKKLKAQGYSLSVLGVATNKGAPIPTASGNFMQNADGKIEISHLPQESLTALAHAGGGRFVSFSNSDNDIKQLLSAAPIAEQLQHNSKATQKIRLWLDQGRWLLLPVLLLMLLAFRKGWLEEI